MVGEPREQIGMCDDAGALRRVERDLLETVSLRERHTVEFRQPVIHHHVVGLQQLAVVGFLAPDDLLDEDLQRAPQIGDQRGVKARENIRLFPEVGIHIELQPAFEKAAELGLRPRVRHQAAGLLGHLVLRPQPARAGGLQQLSIRQGIPRAERQPGGHGVVVLPRAQFRIEEPRRLQDEDDGAFHGLLRRDALGEN